jgi:hypothetical protein
MRERPLSCGGGVRDYFLRQDSPAFYFDLRPEREACCGERASRRKAFFIEVGPVNGVDRGPVLDVRKHDRALDDIIERCAITFRDITDNRPTRFRFHASGNDMHHTVNPDLPDKINTLPTRTASENGN